MKDRLITFLLFIIMIILILGIAGIGYYIYSDLTNEEVAYKKIEGIITEKPSEKHNEIVYPVSSNIDESIQSILDTSKDDENIIENSNQSNSFKFFYNQLDDVQKDLYNELEKNKQNLKYGDYVIEYGNRFSDILSTDGGGEKLENDYQTAIEAFMHDNPDLFYLDVNKMFLNIKTITRLFSKTYDVYMSPAEGTNYLSDDFQNVSEIEYYIKAIEKIKNYVLDNIEGTDYQKILTIHNYLVDSIEYDSTYDAKGTYSIYGALIGRKCVCEGYAKAFKYLINAAGIECEIMQGTGTNSKGETENHAWNCVKIGNTWYEVDPTWNDPIVIGIDGNPIDGAKSDSIRYKFLLKGSQTFEKDHTLEYQFSEGGKVFEYPSISESDYKR